LALALSGCETDRAQAEATGEAEAAGQPVSVVVVAGSHANAPQIGRIPTVDSLLTRAAQTQGFVAFVTAEGTPSIFDGAGAIVGSDAPTARIRDEENASWVAGLTDLLRTQVRANTPEVDTLEALRLANRTLSAAPAGERHIVVIDSGLSTTGVLDFTQEGMLFAVAGDVAGYLQSTDALIPFAQGMSIDWYGMGDVSEPQAALTNRQRTNLTDIWRAIIEASGAELKVHSDPPSPTPGSDLPPVTVVDIEPEPLPTVIELDEPVIFDEGVLHFVPGYADFIDPEQARRVLTPYAQLLAEHPELMVHVVGTTAEFGGTGSDDVKGSYDLSWSRAGVVTQTLIDLGAPTSQLEPEGQGQWDQWHVPELDENGNYLPDKAALNRKVVLLLAHSEHGCVL
jgi:outer membrane protein OmpA-like peptidoglycan-associated protein